MAVINANLTTTAQAIYTSSGQTVVTLLYFCNITGSTKLANLYVVPSSQSSVGAQTYNQIYANYAITTSDTLVVNTEKFILNNGDALYANSNASPSLTATIGYINL
jgi:hypothetical protein